MSIIQPNHYTLQINRDVTEICQPLFQRYELDHFCYARYNFNSSLMTVLITDGLLLNHHFKQKYMITPSIPNKLFNKKFYYIAFPNLSDGFNQAVYDYQTIFKLNYPIYCFDIYPEYFDLFIYAAKGQSSNIINSYLNNMDVLEKFKFYFKEKAEKLIKQTEQHMLLIPKNMQSNINSIVNTQKLENYFDNKIKHYKLEGKYKNITLTKREVETFICIAQGYTIKEAAKLMNISHRTAETYINNARNKLHITKKSEILNILRQNNLII